MVFVLDSLFFGDVADDSHSSFWRVCWVVFLAQGLVGVCLFEWAWKQTERVRLGQEELFREFPSFRRLDVHLWSRRKFYPGCFLVLVPRTCWIFGCVFVVGGCQRLLFAFQDMSVPLKGWRRALHKRVLWIMVPLVIFAFGYRVEMTDHDEEEVDALYQNYLGPEWKQGSEEHFRSKKVSTVVSNHVGFLEILAYLVLLDSPPAFTPARHVQNFPIGDHFVRSLNSIYVDRGKDDPQKREAVVQAIHTRQRRIETDKEHDWGPLCLFAEGSVTNGNNLSRFRRGAFSAGVAVQPIYFKYRYPTVCPDYAIVKGLELGFLMVSTLSLGVFEAHRYPPLVPNDYLYKEYAKTVPNYKTKEKWEIYAHAVEDLLRHQGGFGCNRQALREKVSLQRFVWGETDEISVNGKTFYWPPRGGDTAKHQGADADPAATVVTKKAV